MRSRSGSFSLLAIALLCATATTGCGSDSPTFSAEELITELNEEGARLRLGGPLPQQGSDAEVRRVILPAAPRAPAANALPGLTREPSAGLIVEKDTESALSRYRSCQETPALVCYRAANVVLYINTDSSSAVQQRVRSAFLSVGDAPAASGG